ncbi:MAG: hypothetical protein JW940_13020 [Polyangiaceae bacterium]|nr:hypothetical protein [Polyangiaceae bacterium]
MPNHLLAARTIRRALAVVVTGLAIGAKAAAAPPRLHVRGTSRIEARAVVQPAAQPWRVGLRGVLVDDANAPIAGQRLAVELRGDGPDALAVRFAACSQNASADAGPIASRTTTKTDRLGAFCLELSDWTSDPRGRPLDISYSGNADYDASAATVSVNRIKRVVTLQFAPPPRRLALEKKRHNLRVQTAIEPPYAPKELADTVDLELVLHARDSGEASRSRLVARASARAGQSASLEFGGVDLGPAGPATLTLRARPNPAFDAAERLVRIVRTARVTLSLRSAPVVSGPTDPVTFDVEARAGGSLVPVGAVDAAVGSNRVTTPVRGGLARPALRLGVPRGSTASVSLRYLPGRPWWESGSPLELELRVPQADPWSQAPWIIAAGLVVLWLGRSWWRPRPSRHSAEHRPARPVTGRPALDVVGHCTDAGSWTGIVLDAHEGTPLADVVVRASWPGFGAHSLELCTVTDQAGAFKLEGESPGTNEGAMLEVRSRSHARLRRPLPLRGTLRIALVSRRRALLDSLVRWARRRGHPWWRRGEPTPAQVAREARARDATTTAVWAEAIQAAAFGPTPPLEGQEEALAEPRAQALAPTEPAGGVEEETPSHAARR